ncbi:MAG: aspartate--tRNA ligase [Actinomycetota bacterium]|nr:aspartate--tRNA ligase [Actinomycetota bacterium]
MTDSIFRTGMRTNLCGEVNKDFTGKEVVLSGWVNRNRDHGKLIFIDLRDFSGVVQLIFDTKINSEAYKIARKLRSEYVIKISGKVRKRSKETINPSIPTGEIEVVVDEINVMSSSKTPPFMLEESKKVDEDKRLKYRYIDLRTEEMQKNLRLRHRITEAARKYFNSKGFLEIETPIMAKSTPEGARDFLVPSRLNPGKFYALPQSPQLFKQLLMFSGFDRCYQIARCFRDEDLRADRQPEFTQVDLEMTFVEADDVIRVIENLFSFIFRDVFNKKIEKSFKRITWKDSMEIYGTDKPDLRFGLTIKDISHIFKGSKLKIFKNALEKSNGCIKSIVVDDFSSLTRKELDDIVELAKKSGAGGLAWIKIDKDISFQSPIAKFLSGKEKKDLIEYLNLKENNLILIVADKFTISCRTLGIIRNNLADKLKLVNKDELKFTWVYDFPLFEWDDNEKRINPVHHPFTKPDKETADLLESQPLKVKSDAYDIVLNGEEIGGGSLRINDSKMQKKIFKILDMDEKRIRENFGFFIEAMDYGVPPHGGIALGMDRMVMLLGKLDSIREVIAFPKTQSAVCMLTGSPSAVTEKQLEEVNINIKKTGK